eukprot:scaffold679290_cov80-Prasinocladus_malaysianus.AAC.1
MGVVQARTILFPEVDNMLFAEKAKRWVSGRLAGHQEVLGKALAGRSECGGSLMSPTTICRSGRLQSAKTERTGGWGGPGDAVNNETRAFGGPCDADDSAQDRAGGWAASLSRRARCCLHR